MQAINRDFSILKKRILQYLDYKGIDNKETYEKTGISNGVFSQKNGISEDNLLRFLNYYQDLNPEWLLTGEGELIKGSKKEVSNSLTTGGIPLVGIEAFGGLGSLDMAISEQDIQARYVIPDFERSDFMLRVTGNSMAPTYNSGDVVACKLIQESNFIQWGRPHIIGTRDQGIMIKRLKPGPDKETYMAVSDNNNYEPFHLPVSQITSIALVTGMIRIE
jgi:repressor LexA